MKLSGQAAASVLAALLLSGCNGEPEPEFEDSGDAHTTSAATTAAVERSARAEERALLLEFLEEFELAMGDGDLVGLQHVSGPDCDGCDVIAANIQDAYARGGRIECDGFDIASLQFQRAVGRTSLWTADLESAQQVWFDGRGKVTKVIPAAPQLFSVVVGRWQGRHVIADIGHQGPQ